MSLTLQATEVPVEEFRLDIEAQTLDGHVVIIENQLERTDYRHLGQLLVYASRPEAAAVEWVAPRFREDHRRTLAWLNERTDTGVDFIGVEVSVVQIVVQIGDTGPRARVFEVDAGPTISSTSRVGWPGVVGSSRNTSIFRRQPGRDALEDQSHEAAVHVCATEVVDKDGLVAARGDTIVDCRCYGAHDWHGLLVT